MAERTGIAWTDHTFNPWIGCQAVSEGCKNCLAPDTLILYRDWTWRPLSEAAVGDELLGFPESGGTLMRRLEVSTVEKVWPARQRALEIRTPEHSIVASYGHPFVARKAARAWRWKEPCNFTLLGTYLRALTVTPMEPFSPEYMRGYISGSTEGDGTFRLDPEKQSYWRVAVITTQQSFLERLGDFLRSLGIADLDIKPFNNGTGGAPMIRIETRRRALLERIKEILDMAVDNVSQDFAKGWLAGMFDAEGSSGITKRKDRNNKVKQNNLRISNTVETRIERIVHYGKITGFDFQVEKFKKNSYTARLRGGTSERGRFYGTVRPAVEYKVNSCLQTEVPATEAQIIAMSDMGETDLIDIQTSTGTFFANGFAVHNCYAETLVTRYGWTEWGPEGVRVKTKPDYWRKPLAWNRAAEREGTSHLVFCASLADVFDNRAPEGAREELWELIAATPHLDWQLLTKRPQNMAEMLPADWGEGYPNVWLGATAENQEEYDRRWPIMAATPAALRFISYEPALGPLTLAEHGSLPDWLIWGGESGRECRPMQPAWARAIRDECLDLGIAVFAKQWGDYRHSPLVVEQELSPRAAREIDPHGKGGALLDGELLRQFPVRGNTAKLQVQGEREG